ncbi:porin [uncultured Shimia sp.]|uniref:porin n=1 Tax=uncultured Shimia sp. TaxID=573152 RepID=UPI00261BE4E6|nr:porin [uncultured Shimia sp.]
MKKVLFATTALVATAGVAAADVTFGGLGRFGVLYNEGNPTDEWSLTSRFRLIVTGTAESDNGLSFGAQIRYQADGHEQSQGVPGTTGGTAGLPNSNAASTAGFNTPRFWVTAGGFTVSVGQTLGAIENMPNMYTGSIGLTGLGFANVVYNFGADAYSSGSGGTQGLDVIWSGGAWGVHFTHSWSSDGNLTLSSDRTAMMVSYAFGNWTIAGGYQDSDIAGDTEWAITSGATFGAWDVAFNIADNDGFLKYGVGANWQAGASTFVRGYINHDEAADMGSGDENMGIGFQHRLGGGTFVEGGVADLAGTTRADLGLRFSF